MPTSLRDSPSILKSNSGQAVVEYILTLVTVIALAATLRSGFRTAILSVWSFYTRSITAACPTGCPSNYRQVR